MVVDADTPPADSVSVSLTSVSLSATMPILMVAWLLVKETEPDNDPPTMSAEDTPLKEYAIKVPLVIVVELLRMKVAVAPSLTEDGYEINEYAINIFKSEKIKEQFLEEY